MLGEIIASIINAITNNIDYANSLDEKINLINQNVQFNITLMWAMLAVIAATAGIALFSYAKTKVNERVNEELDKRIDTLKNELNSDLKKFVYKNPQLLVYKLNNTKVLEGFDSIVLQLKGHDGDEKDIIPDCSLDYVEQFKIYSPISKRYISFHAKLEEKTFTFDLEDYDRTKDGDLLNVTLVMLNKKYELTYSF